MPTVCLIDHHTVYDNLTPSLRSRHAYIPGLSHRLHVEA